MDLPLASVAPTRALDTIVCEYSSVPRRSEGRYLRSSVANGSGDLSGPEELASELGIVGVRGKVQDGTVSTDVEDSIVVVGVDFGELLGRSEFVLDDRVGEELDGLFVGEKL